MSARDNNLYAPPFPDGASWLNTTKELKKEDLKGYVVLLDFWTYCCINCIHVLPDLKYLENKYKDKPFLVIGVHSPKFTNEKRIENVISAVQRYEIKHPVIADNDRVLWDAYAVRAWPTFVLLDAEGGIRGQVAGEGWRLQLDKAIEGLLDEGRNQGVLVKSPPNFIKKMSVPKNTLSFPGKITTDAAGEYLYISDTNHNRIIKARFQSPTQVEVEEIVAPKNTSFNHPQGLCLVNNFLYVCDTGNHLIKRIDLKQNLTETVAGNGEQGTAFLGKKEALGTALNSPWDLDYAEGYLYIAMAGSHQIISLSISENTVEGFAGSGIENIVDANLLASQLAQPSGISIYENRIFFTDSEVSAVRYIDLKENEVKTLIGKGLFEFGSKDGPFKEAEFQHPLGLFAQKDVVYVADTYNHSIRKVDLKKEWVTSLIKRDEEGRFCTINDRSCEVLPLFEPNDVHLLNDNLFIADTNNHLIRVFNLKGGTLKDVSLKF